MQEIDQTLVDLGLTPVETKILLCLCKFECATVKDMSKSTGEHRQEIYPILNELLKKGLIEKKMGIPNHYKCPPLAELLKILLERKTKWISKVQEKTTALIKSEEIKAIKKVACQPEYEFSLISGMEKIGKVLSDWQNNAKAGDYVIRYDQYDYQLGERIGPYLSYKRNPDYKARVVMCTGNVPFGLTSAEIKFTSMAMPAEISIYDGKRGFLWIIYDRTNIFSKEIAVLTSNHPSFVKMLQDYFDMLWENSPPEKNKGKKASTL